MRTRKEKEPPRGAGFARHRSVQDYATPWEFVDAVERKFGVLQFDLAAHTDNCRIRRGVTTPTGGVSMHHMGPGSGICSDAFARDWCGPELRPILDGKLCWLNPPFGDIAPWAERCADAHARLSLPNILLLVPASVGSNWWAEHVHRVGRVYFVRPRLSFDGKGPYPKDVALIHYGDEDGYETWKWDEPGGTRVPA